MTLSKSDPDCNRQSRFVPANLKFSSKTQRECLDCHCRHHHSVRVSVRVCSHGRLYERINANYSMPAAAHTTRAAAAGCMRARPPCGTTRCDDLVHMHQVTTRTRMGVPRQYEGLAEVNAWIGRFRIACVSQIAFRSNQRWTDLDLVLPAQCEDVGRGGARLHPN